jgi:uncharacterized protein YqgC (DUF456 family)
MRAFTWLVGVAAAILGVFGLAVPGLCPVAIILALVFLLLAARQSRLDREAREDRRIDQLARNIRQGQERR